MDVIYGAQFSFQSVLLTFTLVQKGSSSSCSSGGKEKGTKQYSCVFQVTEYQV